MNHQSNVRIKPLSSKNIVTVASFFAANDFFYSTKRPDSLTAGEVGAILKDPKRIFYVLENCEQSILGLCDYKIDVRDFRNVTVEFRIFRQDDWILNGRQAWFLFLEQLFDNHNFNRVTKNVYQFDRQSQTLCEHVGFTQEAILKESVFKYGSYFDTLVYSILQKDFASLKTTPSQNDIKFDFESLPKMLEGKKIKLRMIEKRDYALIYNWESSETTYLNVNDSAYDVSGEKFGELLEKRILNEKPKNIQFIIETRNGKAIGTVGLYSIDWRNKCAEIVITLGEEKLFGLGYGFLATNAITKFAFAELNLNNLYSNCFSCNERIMQSAKQGNVQFTANLRKNVFKNGHYYDVLVV